jgi:hypothetical protein
MPTIHRNVTGMAVLRSTGLRCLVAALCLVSAPLWAASSAATDKAFAALLSMPGAGPESGSWNFPQADDFEPGNEDALIGYLAGQQKAGADVNAYRHFGTLLHHAIRSRQARTALWLLAHGADPRKPVKDDGRDALALAIAYKLETVAAVLTRDHGMRTPAPLTAQPNAPRAPSSLDAIGQLSARLQGILQQVGNFDARPDAFVAPDAAVADWDADVAKLPAGARASLFDDDDTLAAMVMVHGGSAALLDAALSGLPASLLVRRADAALRGLVLRAPEVRFGVGTDTRVNYAVPADAWRVLWRRLPHPLNYRDATNLAERVPPDAWPDLFASGYAVHDAEPALGCLMVKVTPAYLKDLWPRLQTHFHDIRAVLPRMVLSPYRLAGRYACYSHDDDSTLDKLRFLASLGLRRPVHGLSKPALERASKELLAAIEPFMPTAAERAAIEPRLVGVKLGCRFKLSDAWYSELLGEPVIDTEGVYIDTVQPIELPGESECGLLLAGSMQVNHYRGGPRDSFTGPEYEPIPSCPDPTDRTQVWLQRSGKIIRLPSAVSSDYGNPALVPVRDTVTGRRYYLHIGDQYGKCTSGRRMPFLFEWKPSAGGGALVAASKALDEALLEQCDALERDLQCKGIPALADQTPAADAFAPLPLAEFIKTHRKDQYDAYLAAVLALDRPRFRQFAARGVPGDWTADAIQKVSVSALPLIDKRRRTAMLFADRIQLGRSLRSDVLEGLVDWLPYEDWRPVLDALSKRPDDGYVRTYLRERVAAKGLQALACDLDHLQGLMCGGSFSADR